MVVSGLLTLAAGDLRLVVPVALSVALTERELCAALAWAEDLEKACGLLVSLLMEAYGWFSLLRGGRVSRGRPAGVL